MKPDLFERVRELAMVHVDDGDGLGELARRILTEIDAELQTECPHGPPHGVTIWRRA